MKYLSIISILFLSISKLKGNPWEIDKSTRDVYASRLSSCYQKHKCKAWSYGRSEYFTDFAIRTLNFRNTDCKYCQNPGTSSRYNPHDELAKLHFKKIKDEQPSAHCWGVSLLFIKQLLNSPQLFEQSCTYILSVISKTPKFKEQAHFFSLDQYPYYQLGDSKHPLQFDVEAMKLFFLALLKKQPSSYLFLPFYEKNNCMDEVSMFATLKSLPNQLILLTYSNADLKSNGDVISHCIVISTHPDKYFLFDSNLGIYEFPDLETLSHAIGNVKKIRRLRCLVSFPIDKNNQRIRKR